MSSPLMKYLPPRATRWKLWSWTDIPDKKLPERVYLRRLRIVQTPWFALYLHWIYGPDTDRDPHDHPWNFWSFIVRGWYREIVFPNPVDIVMQRPRILCKEHGRFSLHQMDTNEAHSITSTAPNLLTLVFCGKRVREWGFWTIDGFVPWREYIDSVGLNPPLDEFS